jgi:hypothetical protein
MTFTYDRTFKAAVDDELGLALKQRGGAHGSMIFYFYRFPVELDAEPLTAGFYCQEKLSNVSAEQAVKLPEYVKQVTSIVVSGFVGDGRRSLAGHSLSETTKQLSKALLGWYSYHPSFVEITSDYVLLQGIRNEAIRIQVELEDK